MICKGPNCQRDFDYILMHLSQAPQCKAAYSTSEYVELESLAKNKRRARRRMKYDEVRKIKLKTNKQSCKMETSETQKQCNSTSIFNTPGPSSKEDNVKNNLRSDQTEEWTLYSVLEIEIEKMDRIHKLDSKDPDMINKTVSQMQKLVDNVTEKTNTTRHYKLTAANLIKHSLVTPSMST